MHIDHLVDFLLVRDRDFEGGPARNLDFRVVEGVKAFFLDSKVILPLGKRRELAASAVVGPAVQSGLWRGF